jgi:hypothetical protein
MLKTENKYYMVKMRNINAFFLRNVSLGFSVLWAGQSRDGGRCGGNYSYANTQRIPRSAISEYRQGEGKMKGSNAKKLRPRNEKTAPGGNPLCAHFGRMSGMQECLVDSLRSFYCQAKARLL